MTVGDQALQQPVVLLDALADGAVGDAGSGDDRQIAGRGSFNDVAKRVVVGHKVDQADETLIEDVNNRRIVVGDVFQLEWVSVRHNPLILYVPSCHYTGRKIAAAEGKEH